MDENRVKGSAKNAGGKLKAAAGKALGDSKLKREGQADQVKGRVQNALGGAKDGVREADRKKRR